MAPASPTGPRSALQVAKVWLVGAVCTLGGLGFLAWGLGWQATLGLVLVWAGLHWVQDAAR